MTSPTYYDLSYTQPRVSAYTYARRTREKTVRGDAENAIREMRVTSQILHWLALSIFYISNNRPTFLIHGILINSSDSK